MRKDVIIASVMAIGSILLGGPAAQAQADQGVPAIEADGTVNVEGFALPPSMFLSEEAKASLPRTPTDPSAPMRQLLASGDASAMRARIPEFMAPRLEHLKELYSVETEAAEIGGVPVVVAMPSQGVPRQNRKKVLINLPGGGFVMGTAGGTGLVESIPVAGTAGVKIVSVSYRQSPEEKFPAASEDVAKVYRELLKDHQPEDIGIFGCSAGGLLTAESIAWFLKEELPLPGAIGIFCASADARWGGDSRAFARPFQGLSPDQSELPYFSAEDKLNPLASPVLDSSILAQFPPTLLVTGTRAMELSAAVNTHKELLLAGVEADIVIWDGLGHAFFYDPDLPESKEAVGIMADHFAVHLGLAR